jgi:hypothetical protein
MSRSAGSNVNLKASVRRFGQLQRAAHVVRQHTHFDAGGEEIFAHRLDRFEHGVDDRIVTDVRPRVIHVEKSDVDEIVLLRRRIAGDADVLEEIVMNMDVALRHSVL